MNLHPTKDKPIQFQLVDYLTEHTRSVKFKDSSFNSKCHYLFSNFRLVNKVPTGLRLTNRGYKLLNRFFDYYEYESDEELTGSILLSLDNNMKWPYYIDGKKVILYNREDAGWFKLSGNLKYFGESF